MKYFKFTWQWYCNTI